MSPFSFLLNFSHVLDLSSLLFILCPMDKDDILAIIEIIGIFIFCLVFMALVTAIEFHFRDPVTAFPF